MPKPKYRGFAEGVKGHRPPRWQDAVALVKSGQATVAEAAWLIGVSRQRVHRWVTGDRWAPDVRRYRKQFLQDLWKANSSCKTCGRKTEPARDVEIRKVAICTFAPSPQPFH